jgi:hypothetical protein
MTDPAIRRTFTEAEILLLKELTVSEVTRVDTDTHANETGSRRVRHVGSGPSVEEARKMNQAIRDWGPMMSASMRGNWIRDSRDRPVLAALAVSASGALHFTKPVEPQVLDELMRMIAAIDAASELTWGTDVVVGLAWQVLTQDPKNAGLPPQGLYVRDAVSQIERFVSPLVRGNGTTAPYPKKVQAAANVFCCATICAIKRRQNPVLGGTKMTAPRAKTLAKALGPVVQGVFKARIAPASGAVPTPAQIEAAMLWVESHFAENGPDFPKLFAALAAALTS